jgi:hypothetical protein
VSIHTNPWYFAMSTVMVSHGVDDVEHWLASPLREQIMAPLVITLRTFVDPSGTNQVGFVAEIPDTAFQELLGSDAGAEAMKHVGVHPDTVMMLVAS